VIAKNVMMGSREEDESLEGEGGSNRKLSDSALECGGVGGRVIGVKLR